ncbi:MAG: CDP-diacylglycerol--serine O-phosphatidyltransferase [Verrucomicrobiae bacterium]|nr:CDP-diacylglycerol--serine O-phosphatidyltransferase [Verrucomicrobiae bacterium]
MNPPQDPLSNRADPPERDADAALDPESERLRIFLLPNLFTAGNLFCGFLALTRIVEADLASPSYAVVIKEALFYIFLACIFDLLDGRVARLGGFESPFGREFDSLADIVSFGVAPAFLVHRIVLKDVFHQHPEVGWFIASLYVICGAFRLARFNCLASATGGGGRYFLGFPIPAAAGMVASLTLFMLWWNEKDFRVGSWRYALPVILVFLSAMMVSEVKYPTFKKLNWRTQHPFSKTLLIVLLIGMLVILWKKILPVVAPFIFSGYLLYGFIRPFISQRLQRELEVDDDPEDDLPGATNGAP